MEDHNFMAWLSGRYITEAIASVLSKKAKYPQEPYKLQSKNEMQKDDIPVDVVKFMAYANALNATRLSK